MIGSPEFWVAVAFVILLAMGLYWGLRPILGMLDQRSARIRKQIDEAQQLREEAQRTLAEYKRRQRDAAKEAEEIVEHAKEEAKRLRERAETDIERQLERREQMTIEKIEQAEQQALQEVREQAVEVAVAATARLLRENLGKDKQSALVDEAIEDISKRLH